MPADDPLAGEPDRVPPVEQQVHRAARQVAALDQDPLRAERADRAGRGKHRGLVSDRHAGDQLRFQQVGRHHRGQREQQFLDCLESARGQQAVSVLRHGHRVHHHRCRRPREGAGDGPHDRRGGEHASLDRVHGNVAKYRVKLSLHRAGRHFPVPLHPQGVLRGHRADHAHPVHPEREHGLQVGLYPRPACRVRTRYREHARRSRHHTA